MTWWSRFWRRDELEQDLGRELDFHVAERMQALKNSGQSKDEARRKVRQEFGGVEQVKEECRSARGTLWLESTIQDAAMLCGRCARVRSLRWSWCSRLR
jgi:hypothetical protein